MSILNSLPKKIGVATETSNGLMSADDKKLVNKINNIENNVNNKLNKNVKIKSSQLDTSTDSGKIQINNLSEEVKNMIIGATPMPIAKIQNGSIIKDYLADNAVTSDKRTAAGSIAVFISSDFCNFSTIGDSVELTFPKDYTLFYGTNRLDIVDILPDPVIIEKEVPSIIVYNTLNGFSAYSQKSTRPNENIKGIDENDYILGAFDGENVTMFYGKYTVDGNVVLGDNINGDNIKNFSIDSKKFAISHAMILSDKTEGSYINIDFNSQYSSVRVVKAFDISIADQYVKNINPSFDCIVPDNDNNKRYLYIYYNLGSDDLKASWSSIDIEQSILDGNDILVLLGVIDTINKVAVGLNKDYFSINSVSLKNKKIEYTDIFTGQIFINFKDKQIVANNVKSFIDGSITNLTESDTQVIKLTDDEVSNITTSGITYTLAAIRTDFNLNTYKLKFVNNNDINSIGLDSIILTSIKKYDLSHNKENIIIVKPDGNIVKSNNIISSGYTLPIDDETIIAELSTETISGNLMLTSTLLPGSFIVDPASNIVYNIKEETNYKTTIENLHGLYSVLFNTETMKLEIIPISDNVDNKKYVSLGFVYELSDSLAYKAIGSITNHITLNAKRPSNYATITGPDPDKGYDWSKNRLVIPKDIYLLTNSQYSLYCQNMSMNRYVDNDYISYEIGLPTSSVITENAFTVNSILSGTFESRIVGKFKGNNSCLFKDINIHFEKPEGKPISILCIGDDTVSMNMPGYINEYLTQLGYTPTMLGKVKNMIDVNGYGMTDIQGQYGEGHTGWRFTDFMCKTKHRDKSPYYIPNNPFMSNSKFNFSHYMTSNSYNSVDAVVISVGLNDILGNHTASATEDIEKLSIGEIIELFPYLYKEMISSIHEFNPDIKIIINPTMIKGIDDEFNKKSLLLTETILYDLKDIENVFFAPGYLTQPMFVSATKKSTEAYTVYNDINDTKLGSCVNSTDINGVGQSNLAFIIASTIIGVTK